MTRPRLHLDADVSLRSLYSALIDQGHDVTRTPVDWMPEDASDRMQLLEATARGRIILTFNIRDFIQLAREYPHHHGIVLAYQRTWSISILIKAVDRLLSETKSEEWIGQVRWLNDWR